MCHNSGQGKNISRLLGQAKSAPSILIITLQLIIEMVNIHVCRLAVSRTEMAVVFLLHLCFSSRQVFMESQVTFLSYGGLQRCVAQPKHCQCGPSA